jgi:hypothetical protein
MVRIYVVFLKTHQQMGQMGHRNIYLICATMIYLISEQDEVANLQKPPNPNSPRRLKVDSGS